MKKTLSNADYDLTSAQIKAHFNALDLVELLENNKLYSMFKSGCIDYALYRGLNLITTYELNAHDKRYNIVTPNKCRYKNLLRQFKHWYKLSSISITLSLWDKIKSYVWDRTYYNEDIEGHKNTAYADILHNEVNAIMKLKELKEQNKN